MFKKSLIASVSTLMLVSSLSTGVLNAKAYTDEENKDIQVQEMNKEDNIKSVNISEESSKEDQIFMENGIKNELSIQETDDSVVVTIENEKGNKVFTRKKGKNHIHVDSNYLSDDEINNLEEETNNVQIDVDDVDSKSLMQTETYQIEPMKQTGKWVWSSWKNYTITTGAKYGVTAIAAAIASYIPYVGPLASAFASIIVNNSMNTGYFRSRQGSRMDTSPNYVWRRSIVRLYKDAARTKLLSSKTTGPRKEWVSH